MASQLIQYVALQLLVLAASLDEKLRETNEGVLPLTASPKITPANLVDLIAEARTRAALIAPAAAPAVSAPVSPPAVPGSQPGKLAPPAAVHPLVAVAQAPVSPPVVPSAPSPPVMPTAAATAPPVKLAGRRKRSIEDIASAVTGVVSDVVEAVDNAPALDATPIGVVADVVAPVLERVDAALSDSPPSDSPPTETVTTLSGLISGVVAPTV